MLSSDVLDFTKDKKHIQNLNHFKKWLFYLTVAQYSSPTLKKNKNLLIKDLSIIPNFD